MIAGITRQGGLWQTSSRLTHPQIEMSDLARGEDARGEDNGQRLGQRHVVTLGPVQIQIQIAKRRKLGGRLGAFGDEIRPSVPAEAHEGAGQGTAGWVSIDPPGQRLIELDHIRL